MWILFLGFCFVEEEEDLERYISRDFGLWFVEEEGILVFETDDEVGL